MRPQACVQTTDLALLMSSPTMSTPVSRLITILGDETPGVLLTRRTPARRHAKRARTTQKAQRSRDASEQLPAIDTTRDQRAYTSHLRRS